jgi:hypothetical protein
MVAWWDASDTNTLTIVYTNRVTQWSDKSGLCHLSQVTYINMPYSGTRTQNSLNVLDCQGFTSAAGGALMTNCVDSVLPSSGNVTFFIVDGIDGLNSINAAVYSITGATDFQYDANNTTQWNGRVNCTGNASVDLSAGPHHGPSIYEVDWNWDTSTYTAYIDGISRASAAYTSQLSTNARISVNCNRNWAKTIDGFMAEFIIIADATTETRQQIEGYLAWKWGTQDKLAADHPYKSAAP